MEESTENTKQSAYIPKERLSAPFPIPINILDNMEEDPEEENEEKPSPKSRYDNY